MRLMKMKNPVLCALLFFIMTAAFLPVTASAAVITSVDITLKEPISGTHVIGNGMTDDPEYGETRQSPQAEVILPADAGYELWIDEGWNYALWQDYSVYQNENEFKAFTGVMNCGNNYIADITLRAKRNNTFSSECHVKVNGQSPLYVEPVEYDGVPGLRVCAVIQPAHRWEWIDKTPAGLLKNGTRCQRCSSCGAEQGTTVISGYAKSYVKSVKAVRGKKSISVRWKKQSRKNRKQFGGYEIRYSKNPDMSNAMTVRAGKGASQKKIRGLSKKTKYYVQVRTYTRTSEGVFYSRWSSRKSVKTR